MLKNEERARLISYTFAYRHFPWLKLQTRLQCGNTSDLRLQ